MTDTKRVVKERDRRNLNPTIEARVAMTLYGDEYCKQMGGSMDFWDSLSNSRKDFCSKFVQDIEYRLLGRKSNEI